MCYNEQAKNVDKMRTLPERRSSINQGDGLPTMRMNEPMTLGRWIKRLRADLDMTQEALAKQLGCAVQTIWTFEIGKRRPSRELRNAWPMCSRCLRSNGATLSVRHARRPPRHPLMPALTSRSGRG